jgi:hypothetical protein
MDRLSDDQMRAVSAALGRYADQLTELNGEVQLKIRQLIYMIGIAAIGGAIGWPLVMKKKTSSTLS